jgi:translocation protein SEC62
LFQLLPQLSFKFQPKNKFAIMSMEQQAKSPPDLKKVAQFLRSGSAGIKVRVGALNGKRIDYFKGKPAHLQELKRSSYSYIGSRQICGESPVVPCIRKAEKHAENHL